MNTFHAPRRGGAGVLLPAGVGVAGPGLGAVTAHAQPGPAPLNHWPGCTEEHPQGQ